MAANNPNALPKGFILNSPTGTYRILEILGSGGFGITYLANTKIRFGNFSQTVTCAIKEHFLSDMCGRANNSQMVYSDPVRTTVEDSMKDFIAEAQRLQQVGANHPNIVKVNEVFQANGTAYYVMEYLNGRSLRNYIEENGPQSQADLFNLLCPIMEAVDFLHAQRVTHLDIKPDNIMLTEDEDESGTKFLRPVLIDFGLSKHYDEGGRPTSTLKTLGCSDGYSPIEQYGGITTFSPASDIYALAATCLFCLTGKDPAKSTELFRKDLPGQIAALNLTPAFSAILQSALSPDPDARPVSLLTGHAPGPAPAPAPPNPGPNPKTTPNPDPNPTILINRTPNPPIPPRPTNPTIFNPTKSTSVRTSRKPLIYAGSAVVFCLALTCLILFSGSSRPNSADFIPVAGGYQDQNGNWVIEPQFDMTTPFSEGFASVKKGKTWSLIDSTGVVISPLKFETTRYFKEGMCAVKLPGSSVWGFIDNTGKLAIKPKFFETGDFSEGLAVAWHNYRWGFINKRGNWVIQPKFSEVGEFHNGLAPVSLPSNGLWGFIDKTGRFTIDPQFWDAESFSEDLAVVRNAKEYKYGFIDKTGQYVIEPNFDFASSFHEGLAAVSVGEKYGYIDKSGSFVIEPKYDYCEDVKNGKAEVVLNHKRFIIEIKVPTH